MSKLSRLGIELAFTVLSDEIIVALVRTQVDRSLHMAMRWNNPDPIKGKDGEEIETTNLMNGGTDWFIVPLTFSTTIARSLIELKATGSFNFDETGYQAMIEWLVELGELNDAICY